MEDNQPPQAPKLPPYAEVIKRLQPDPPPLPQWAQDLMNPTKEVDETDKVFDINELPWDDVIV